MNAAEGLDIRAPIGGLFTVLGGMLAGYGLFTTRSGGSSELSGAANVNLWWGLVMLVFGIVLLLMARRAPSRPEPAQQGNGVRAPHLRDPATESAVLPRAPGTRDTSKTP
jgi:hypothetical protein